MNTICILILSLLLTACSTISGVDTVTGIASPALFGGTEMGCETSELEIGESQTCNSGHVNIVIDQGDREVHLSDYYCDATELFIRDEEGVQLEFKTSNCSDDIQMGENYTYTGELTLMKDVWVGGKQVDQWWLEVM
jgi:hypothetical protein